jgi:hypothetical protein
MNLDQTFLEWLVGQVGLAGIAGLALYLLNQAWKETALREEKHSEEKITLLRQLEVERQELKALVRQAIEVIATNTEVIR